MWDISHVIFKKELCFLRNVFCLHLKKVDNSIYWYFNTSQQCLKLFSCKILAIIFNFERSIWLKHRWISILYLCLHLVSVTRWYGRGTFPTKYRMILAFSYNQTSNFKPLLRSLWASNRGHYYWRNVPTVIIYTHFFPISNASISNSTQNLGIFKEWVLKTFQLRNMKSVPIKIKECQYSQKNS